MSENPEQQLPAQYQLTTPKTAAIAFRMQALETAIELMDANMQRLVDSIVSHVDMTHEVDKVEEAIRKQQETDIDRILARLNAVETALYLVNGNLMNFRTELLGVKESLVSLEARIEILNLKGGSNG